MEHISLPGEDPPFPSIRRTSVSKLQVNLGYLCNQSCTHCHVNAGPHRKEIMSSDTVDKILDYLRAGQVTCLDLTGGAPELNPDFRRLVKAARDLDIDVIDRCNLSVLLEPGQEGLIDFLAGQRVEIIASLPCYLEENVDRQRGKGVLDKSIRAIRALNRVGYGTDPNLLLHLAFNPTGPVLPPAERALEAEYKRELTARFGVVFNRLITIANMPVGRFKSVLKAKGELHGYMTLLREHFNPASLDSLMCRETISVDWQGELYDCDFNQMLRLPMRILGRRVSIGDLLESDAMTGAPIATASHCFGCTAGQGSSCSGALVA